MSKVLLTSSQLRKLVDIRAEIHSFNIKLLEIVESMEEPEKIGVFPHNIYQLLLGSNFSLWRFAFLIYKERSFANIHSAVQKFIAQLLEDNTMSFGREVENNAWYGGYYGNNSRFRIRDIMERLKKEIDEDVLSHIDGANTFWDDTTTFYQSDSDKPLTFERSLSSIEIQLEMQNKLLEFISNHINNNG